MVVVSGEFTCPDYSKIRTSGVAPANFKIEDVSVKDHQPFLPSSVVALSLQGGIHHITDNVPSLRVWRYLLLDKFTNITDG